MLAASATGAEIGRVSLPVSLIPWDLRPTQHGRIAVFAVGADDSWLNNEPRAASVDPGTHNLSPTIEDVIAGQRDPRRRLRSPPWAAWDIARDRLYARRRGRGWLTVVDLDRGYVVAATELELARRRALAGAWLVPTATQLSRHGSHGRARCGRSPVVCGHTARTQSDDFREFDEWPGRIRSTRTRCNRGPDRPTRSGLALSSMAPAFATGRTSCRAPTRLEW
jgi:hypothetical protein